VVYFQKELDFKNQFLYEASGTLVSLVVSIVLAFTTRSVWALVWGLLAGQIVSSAVSYAIQEYRPRFRYDRSKARELFSFGGWVWGSHILGFVALNGDDVVLGKLLGVRELGFYQTAFRLSQMPANEITQVASRVMFPAYSKIQQNASQLRRTYLHHLQFVSSVVFPLAGGIFVLSSDFTRLVLGQQWMPLVLPLQLLSIAGLLRSIIFAGAPLFMAVGRPKIDFYMTLMRVAVMAVTVIPFTRHWGMAGTCLSVIAGIVSVIPIWVYQSTRPFSLPFRNLLSAFFSPVVGTLGFVAPGLVIVNAFTVGFVGMVGIALMAVGMYLLVQYLFWRRFKFGAILTWQRLLGQF
jgi:lipopolysaccharide exporter